jgi:hypothetical protein
MGTKFQKNKTKLTPRTKSFKEDQIIHDAQKIIVKLHTLYP